MSIEVRHLTHAYSQSTALNTVALEDVSFTVRDGEFIGVVGHTGSGKSTLVQHLNGLLKPTSGQVLVDGEDLNGEHVNRRALRQRIGLVFQYPEYQLFEETVAKDIAFGPKNQGLSQGEIDERVRYALACVHLDYDAVAEKSPFELSGGQMRRVAIAGVLAMQPEMLVLDEPTAMLDPKGRRDIMRVIRKMHDEMKKTVVYITHYMEEAVMADRILVMDKGKVVMDGTPAEIFENVSGLKALHLSVPAVTELAYRLRNDGMPVDHMPLTVDEMSEILAGMLS